MPNLLLRVRNLRTNFHTYAGVVKALDGVSFEMWEGETLGLVGETGCGKSVTALSVLRLIAQPPGKIEEGEVLFDVPEETVREMDRLEVEVRKVLPRVFGETPEADPGDLGMNRMNKLWEAAKARDGIDAADRDALLAALKPLWRAKQPYDLLAKSEEEMRKIRGNRIAMIFQEPMQALNPVFPIGDQIAENILLHQRDTVVRALVDKMELEAERDSVGEALRRADPSGATSLRPLPTLPPPPRALSALALAWLGMSNVAFALFAATLLVPSLFGISVAAPFGFGLVVAAVSAYTAGALWETDPWSRPLGLFLAALQGLTNLFLILVALPIGVRLFFLGAALVDFLVIQRLFQGETKEALTGVHVGWEAALIRADGDPGALSEVRDALAASRLDEATRETLAAQLDVFIARSHAVLDPDEPVRGHFHEILPRGFQLAFYRGLRDRPGASLAGVARSVPFVRRVIERPIYEEALRRSITILRKLRISDPARIARQYPYELSGGMQQRSLIAIALSCNPRLLIADEPTTALDVTIQAQILDLIRKMKREFGSSVLIITHDLGIIAEMCNRVCVMYAGTIAEDATVRAVFKAPLHPYTQGLMKAVPSHTVRKAALEIIQGSVPNLIYPPPGCRFHPRCPMVMPTCGWSPAEVGEQVRDLMRAMAAEVPWAFDVEAVRAEPVGPTELRVVFPVGVGPDAATEAVRRAQEEGRSRPAIGAIVSVEPSSGGASGATEIVVRILNPMKPPDFVPEPDHKVACLLYETPRTVPTAEGARRG